MTLTSIHVALSLIGIVSGLVMLFGLMAGKAMNNWTLVFLVTTVLTNVTGYFFPFHGFTPALAVGTLSMAILIAAVAARYRFHLARAWRWIFVVTAVAALYLNSFVLVVQSFLKIPGLHALAPTGSGPVFSGVQALVLAFYVIAGGVALRAFRQATASHSSFSPSSTIKA